MQESTRVLRKAIRWGFGESLAAPVALLVLATALIVPPTGDFPLNDDWVYAKTVKWSLEQGQYVGHPFSQATFLAQALWGALWTAAFGFSFVTLRISTLVLAGVALWATARTARECGASRGAALLCAAVLWANPLFLNLSYTFMTEVPFAAAAALSMLFCVRALQHGRHRDVFFGSAFAAVAFFVRQFGVLPAVAFAGASAFIAIRARTRPKAGAIVSFLVPWLLAAPLWLWWRWRVESFFTASVDVTDWAGYVFANASSLFHYAVAATFYVGLFLLPFAVAHMTGLVTRQVRWRIPQWIAFGACCVAAYVGLRLVVGWQTPPLTNLLRNLGVGPLTLKDTTMLPQRWAPVRVGGATLRLVKLAAFGSAALLAVRAWFGTREYGADEEDANGTNRHGAILFLALTTLLLWATPCNPWLPRIYDRYLVPGLPPLLVLAALGVPAVRRPWALIAGVVTTALMLVFSMAALQDYLAWNRARWEGVDRLVEEHGASPEQIEAGYEYNGMCTSDEYMRRQGSTDFRDRGPHGWWALDDAYAMSFLPRLGYAEVGRAEYFSALGWETRAVLLLRRTGGETPQGIDSEHLPPRRLLLP
ncbi:MAG: glycosyltransferase family 39 protein [bacterium]|nr:glycosyltransferase family 39 protein [bacterium]